jgi:type I restriction enzyme M protein
MWRAARQERQTIMAAKKAASGKSGKSNGNGANLGFEAKLWLAADKMRNNMDAAEYKHVVLGLIFLKYISDSFEEMHQRLLAAKGEGADPEDADEYRAENVFWVPKEARWARLQGKAKQPTIGKIVDDAMVAIDRDNPRLKGVLPAPSPPCRDTLLPKLLSGELRVPSAEQAVERTL